MFWSKKNKQPTRQAQPALRAQLAISLEARMLFDGAVAATVAETAITATDATPAQTADNSPPQASEAATPPAASSDQHQEIIFVDGKLQDAQALIAGLPGDAEVVVLDSNQDGLQQIADYLKERTDVDAIHLLSHGAEGTVELGNLWLNSQNINQHSQALNAIGAALAADGDILIYGCNTAEGTQGAALLSELSRLTQADVAASDDATGAASKGGDWVLESRTGQVESQHLQVTAYDALLAAPADENYDDDASGTVFNSNTFDLDGIRYVLTGTGTYETSIEDGGISPGVNNGLMFDFSNGNPVGIGGLSSVTISATDGSAFNLAGISFLIYELGDHGPSSSVTLTTSSGETLGPFAPNGSIGNLQHLDLSGNTDFQNITSFTFSGTNLILEIDNLDFEAAVAPNTAPVINNLNTDSVTWAGVGSTVVLDASANASLTDTELGALNAGNGNWNGASLTVQRSSAVAADNFGFNTSGALFSVSGSNLQSGGQTFATYTNTGGVLTVSFTNSGTTPTTALINDVTQRINYRNDTPAGDATIRFTLHDGTVAGTVANVTVTSDSIYVTNTTDTASIDITNGVSFSEAVAIAAADATGSQTIVIDSALAGQTVSTSAASSLGESLALDLDPATGVILSGGTLSIGSGFSLTATNGSSDTASIATTLSGAGGLTKAGAGTVTLSGSNSYTGATSVSAGTLTASGGGAIGDSSSVTVASGATLALSNSETIGNLSGAGAVTLVGNTLTSIITADTTFSGGISGTGGLSVSQSGAATFALTLSGTNTYTGNTIAVNYGWLKLNGDASVSSSSQLRANGNSIITLQSDQTVGSLFSNNANARVQLGAFTLSAGGDNTSTTVSGVISGTGNLVKQGSGTLTLTGTNTYTGTTTMSAGTLSVASDSNLGSNSVVLAAGSTLDITGATNIDNAIVLSGDATISNSANVTLSGVISGANTLTKAGASTLTLSNTNTYAATTVSAGTLSVAGDNNLGSGTVTLASGSTLALTGATNIDNAITLSGNATVSNSANATLSGVISGANNLTKTGASTLTLSNTNTYAATTVSAGTLSVTGDSNLGSGTVTLAGGTTLAVTGATTIDNALVLAGNATVNNSAAVTLSGGISGSGNLSKSGASTLTLSGANAAHAGNTTVNAGTLNIGADSNLGSGSVTLAGGTTLAVTSGGTIDNNLTLAGAATLQVAAATTWSGVISGSNNLAKTGSSTLTLSNTNTLSGTITVSAGTLAVTGTASATTVASGATLIGTGTVDGAVTVQSGGTLSPGLGAGTLTINGDLAMDSGSTLVVDINGATTGTGYDQVIVNGTVDVSGATLSVTHGYSPGSGDSYTIIVNDAADAVTGSFSGLSEGGTLIAGGNSTVLTTSYIGGTGNDLTLTAPLNPVVTSVTVLDADGTYDIGDTVTVVVNFSEQIFLSTGTIQLTLETGTTDRSLSYMSGSGSSTLYFNYTVQEGDNSLDLDYVSTSGLAANGDTIQGASFIDAVLTLPTPGAAGSIAASKDIVIDGVRPTASIVVADTALAIGETSTVTIVFSEAVSGLATDDFTVANGALSGLVTGDGGITWTATLTPTANSTDATNLITLDNTDVQDTAGNTGTGTTDSNNYAIDTLRPTASIVVADTALAIGETSTVTITFNEAVSGLAIGDFTVANGALSGLVTGDGGITWTGTLTPTASSTDASNVITLDNTGVADAAGNIGSGTTNSNNYAIDTLRPTASIVVTDTALMAGQTSTVTISFSEAVSGLSTADLSAANGTLSGLASLDGGVTWTVTLTPDINTEDTSNLITLNNTGIIDAAGNAGTGTTDSNNYAISTVRPTASILIADSNLTVGETSLVTITFSEAVSGFSNADLTVANATLSAISSSDGGITWTATLTPAADVIDTSNLISLDNTGISNAAGNTGSGTSNSNNYTIDTLKTPTLDTGDLEFRTNPPSATPSVPTVMPQPALPVTPPPTSSPLLPLPLFEQPTLGSGIPTLGNIFINNGALAPSFIAQVFASSSSDAGGDGSGSGFLGFGGGDAGVFGSSSLSNVFNRDAMQESEPLKIFDGKKWADEADTRSSFGAPTLGQQLHELHDNEKRQAHQLAMAFSQFELTGTQAGT